MHRQGLAFENLLLDGQLWLRIAHHARWLTIGLSMPDVGDMQERGTLQADINERRLHARQYSGDLAEVDIADQAALQRALDMQFLQGTVFHDGDPCLLRRPVDQYIFLHTDECIPKDRSKAAVSYMGSPMMPE